MPKRKSTRLSSKPSKKKKLLKRQRQPAKVGCVFTIIRTLQGTVKKVVDSERQSTEPKQVEQCKVKYLVWIVEWVHILKLATTQVIIWFLVL